MLHGLLFGFKLHLLCNECGELLSVGITPEDINDRRSLEYKSYVAFVYGKYAGGKGYISRNFFWRLSVDGTRLITKLKSNIKGMLMSVSDKLLLWKRIIIETA